MSNSFNDPAPPGHPGPPLDTISYQTPREAPSNPLGIAGFVVSLVGIFTCGFPSPIGLLLSAIGMRHRPRGLATAGLIMGILGTLAILAFVGFWIFAIYSASHYGRSYMTTFTAAFSAQAKIVSYRTANAVLPADAVGTALLAGDVDGWGHPLRYRQTPGGPEDFEIRSAGSDGIFDNPDDVVFPSRP